MVSLILNRPLSSINLNSFHNHLPLITTYLTNSEYPQHYSFIYTGEEDAPIDYFMAKEILAKLTETAERGLLGSLKGTAGTWERIAKAYESNLFQAAEGGLTLARNVDFEIPYFKKQAAKNQHLMSDLEKRSTECLKSAVVAANEFQKELETMGIPAGSVGTTNSLPGLKKALNALTTQLPERMGTAVEAVKAPGVGDACTYYTAFIKEMVSSDADSASTEELVTLNEIREGRTEAPKETSFPGLGESSGGAAGAAGGGIDWGVEEEAGTGGEVQWDIGGDDTTAGDASGISWDFETVAVTETDTATHDGGDGDASAAGISWDIGISATSDVELTGSAVGTSTSAAGGGTGGIFAAGADVAPEISRLIVDAAYRAKLLDDLHELRAFLKARVNELASENQSLLASAPTEISSIDKAAAASMQTSVDSAIAALTESRTVQLVSLASSAVYCDRLASALARQGGQEGKFRRAAADADARKAEVQRHLVSDSAKLAELVKRTKEVKAGVEAALSTKLGRRVNIQGEINAVLS
jgi:hypothetical protein